ncbi:MAG: cytoplasmic protein [Rhodospirillaceae bacterium]|nr:cytoplasmic protein [Rhodospirillaceae bacterium]|tara:strand:- start:1680 stop:2363 length:684 start_codon:yes stop_codon:yes gene_type:complete
MSQVLMPKATAVWLIENTALTFDQVADFCNLHLLEVQGIADGEVAIGMTGLDPIVAGQLTHEEIKRCTADPKLGLRLAEAKVPRPRSRTKGPRYTPVAKRHDRPSGIAWLVRNFPELTDGQIGRLIGTTKTTINAVRDRTHWNIANIKAQDPVALGICSREDLSTEIEKARRAAERTAKRQKEKEKTRNNITGTTQLNNPNTDIKIIPSSSSDEQVVAENKGYEKSD